MGNINFEINNFRNFRKPTKFKFAPISILIGPNNSGKSSAIKSLLFLKDNMVNASFLPKNLKFGSNETNFKGINDINNSDETIDYSFKIKPSYFSLFPDETKGEFTLDISYSKDYSKDNYEVSGVLILKSVQINYNTEIYQERSQVTGEIAELEVRLPAIRQRLKETEIRSPIDGIVNRVFFISLGAVVSSGEIIAEIVPTQGKLLVEAFIDPKDIATIEPGQPAKISLTAYDPSKYGYLLGTLTKVSADTVFREETKSSAYAVNLSIDTEIFESDDIPVSIVPGMIAQVDIIRGERTILEYFWQPVAKMKDTAFRE